ncbi:hypothetical protein NQ317_014915 [Molorchus minor]|uniref:Uncharacterized protein n=1 Tax=Molorchus minor TaxID=1323400 RepID=A0ABQ9JB52_9CUCU|nr:hypothetical protein NQ317_014915 [Molorchus minor]
MIVLEPKNRSPPPKVPKPVVIPPRSLTEEEMEYLDYFTEFCIYTESPSIYGIHINAQTEEEVTTEQEAVSEESKKSLDS